MLSGSLRFQQNLSKTPGRVGPGREGRPPPKRGLGARVGHKPFPRQPDPAPNAPSRPGTGRGEGAPGRLPPSAHRRAPGPTLQAGAGQPGRGMGARPGGPLPSPGRAHPGPRGQAGPPQRTPSEGDECGPPPRVRAATHRPRRPRPARQLLLVAAQPLPPPPGSPAGPRRARALFHSFEKDCDFLNQLYCSATPKERLGSSPAGRVARGRPRSPHPRPRAARSMRGTLCAQAPRRQARPAPALRGPRGRRVPGEAPGTLRPPGGRGG